MGFLSKFFGKNDEKKNSVENQNEGFGAFSPTSFNKIVDIKNEIKEKCHEIMGPDPFWGDLLEKYMDGLSVSDDRKLVYLKRLDTDKDVVNEFSKYLVQNTYDIEGAISVKGRTAKIISEENPELTAIEVYIKLIEEKKQAGE